MWRTVCVGCVWKKKEEEEGAPDTLCVAAWRSHHDIVVRSASFGGGDVP